MTRQTHTAMKNVRIGALLGAAAITAACSPAEMTQPTHTYVSAISITSGSGDALASINDSATLSTRVLDQDGNAMQGAPLRWSFSPAGVVAQESDGVYRAIGNGRVTVVAEVDPGATGVRPGGYWAGRVADSVVIEVRQRAARLTVAPLDTLFSTIGALRRLRVQVTDARGNAMLDGGPALTWQSADPRVVTVDSTGAVRSSGEGASRITVAAVGLTGSATFTVRPRLPHTSCMQFAQRRQPRTSCVTLDFVVHEREAGR